LKLFKADETSLNFCVFVLEALAAAFTRPIRQKLASTF
jgi:hypothetical protein